ncbi:MAG: hypothetical protein MHPSP_004489, partial [Paramarteilia canceri]
MSPEQLTPIGTSKIMFRVSYKSDVWTMGCILYYMLFFITPFYDDQKENHIRNIIYKQNIEYPKKVVVKGAIDLIE